MNWKSEGKSLALIILVFSACYYLPVDWLRNSQRIDNAFWEALYLVKWYAQEHVLLCLVPAFFIAGAVGVFVSQAAVMKYLGPKANKLLAYGVALENQAERRLVIRAAICAELVASALSDYVQAFEHGESPLAEPVAAGEAAG